jgi:hypothetical protein
MGSRNNSGHFHRLFQMLRLTLTHAKILTDTERILSLFTPVKAAVDAGKFPATADVCNLNQAFSRTFMFGQYAARVFHEIKQ